MLAVLEVTAGPHTGRRIALRPGTPVRIGRTTKADYVVAEDTFLSSAHFYVEWSGEQCVVRDLNSSNGTFLNGTRMTEGRVGEGDIITAGQSSFSLRLNPSEEMATMLNAVVLDETRPMPLPANAPPLPAAAPTPPPPTRPILTPSQRALLEILRGLADPIFAVLDRSAAGAFLDEMREAGGAVEILSETTGACLASVDVTTLIAEQLAAYGWGHGWGVYLTSRQQIAIVRNHLRRFQTLLTPDGAEFQFRFFNPALLRSFLPTLSAGEAKTLFGPMSAILAEGVSADELMLFMPGPSGILEKTLPLRPTESRA